MPPVRVVAIAAVAALIPSLAFAAPVAPGRYTGTTKQDVSTRLRVTSKGHVKYHLTFVFFCTKSPKIEGGFTQNLDPAQLRKDGTFRYRETGSATGKHGHFHYRERSRGRIDAHKARGSYTGLIHYDSGRICRAKGVAWSATRR